MTLGLPATAHEEYIDGYGGLRIFLRSWRPATARGVVVIVHGFNSHGGYYDWTAAQLVAGGLAVYALDLRGRGRSDGERYYVQDASEYINDVARVVTLARSREPGLPAFVLGHSAGGVLSCLYTLDHPGEVNGLICESFAHELPAPDLAITVLKGLSHVAPHAHVLRLKIDDFSRDPAVIAAMKADPFVGDEVQPTHTIAEMVRVNDRLGRDFGQITLPVLILHGTADRVTLATGSQTFYDEAGSTDKTLKLYEGHAHDLLNDFGKEQVIGDIRQWIEARLDPLPGQDR
jgi:alpha-beta hydrolase superfamily lysophospholipase